MRRRTAVLALLSLCTAAVAAGSRIARANGPGLPDTIDVSLVPGNTTDLGLEANFGYLDAPDGQNFSWICHDVLIPSTANVTPRFFRGADGSFLATVRSLGQAKDPHESLYYSADGCSWSAVTGLTDVIIQSVSYDPANPAHVIAVSRTGGATPVPNGVYESNDYGQHWSTGTLSLTERFFGSVLFAPGNGQVAYTAASWYTSGGSGYIYSTANGGASWTEHPWTFVSPVNGKIQVNVSIEAISPTNSQVVYARTDGSDDFLLMSSDGAATWSMVHSMPSDDIRGVAFGRDASNAGVWVVSAFDGSFRAPDGRDFSMVSDTSFHARGIDADARGVFVAANDYTDGFALGRTNDGGQTFTPMFVFSNLAGVRSCPANSDVTTICAPLYPALLVQLGLTSPTATPSGNPGGGGGGGGCKCDVGATDAPTLASMLLAIAGAVALVRRRRTH